MASKTMSLKARALSFLARREHGRIELERKLKPHLQEDDDLNATLDFLEQKGWLSNERAAQAFVDARGKRFGKRKLAFELNQRGLDEVQIAAALETVDETAACQNTWERKFGTVPANGDERAKQMRFLLSRGFSSDTIKALMKSAQNVLDDAGSS
jgi:regulatory protein